MKKLIFIIFLIIETALNARVLRENKKKEETNFIPYLEVASDAVNNGKYEKAESILAEAKKCYEASENGCGFAYEDYLQLVAVIYLNRKYYDKAAEMLTKVLQKYPDRNFLNLYIGEAYYFSNKFDKSIKALEQGYESGKKEELYFLLLSKAYKQNADISESLETLINGLNFFPFSPTLLKEISILYTDEGFYKAARYFAVKYNKIEKSDPFLYLYMSDKMREKGFIKDSQNILEEANIIFPLNAEIVERLSYTYINEENYIVAGNLFKKIAFKDKKYYCQAAEAFRAAGENYEAMRLNKFIVNPEKKLSQKLDIYIAEKSYIRAFLLLKTAEKENIKNENILYKLAYSAFKTENYNEMENIISKFATPFYIEKGKKLKELALKCRTELMKCN